MSNSYVSIINLKEFAESRFKISCCLSVGANLLYMLCLSFISLHLSATPYNVGSRMHIKAGRISRRLHGILASAFCMASCKRLNDAITWVAYTQDGSASTQANPLSPVQPLRLLLLLLLLLLPLLLLLLLLPPAPLGVLVLCPDEALPLVFRYAAGAKHDADEHDEAVQPEGPVELEAGEQGGKHLQVADLQTFTMSQ